MKKNLSLFLIAMLAISTTLAQPILRGTGFNSTKGRPIPLSYTFPDASSFVIPNAGNNQTYDRTSVTHTTPSNRDLLPRTQATIPTATHVDELYRDFVSNFIYICTFDQILQIDSSGVVYHGWDIAPSQSSLGVLTGNANDSMTITAQKVRFNRPITIQSFPMVVGKMIQNGTSVLEYSGQLTVAAAGLNKATFTRRYIMSIKDSIVGSGLFRRKNPQGMTIADSVLVSLRNFTLVDSFFINGQPAPNALLGLLGASQGQSTTAGRYNFYKQGRPFAIHTVLFAPNNPTVPTGGSYEWAAAISTPTREVLPEADWSFYPNPVRNHQIFLNYQSDTPVKMTVFDMLGRTVEIQTLPKQSPKTDTPITLNPSLPKGGYMIYLSNNELQKTLKLYLSE